RGGRDVEERQLVRALRVVHAGHLHGVARVPEVLEVDALDDPAAVHVQAGNDSYGQTHATALLAVQPSPGRPPARPGPAPGSRRSPPPRPAWRPGRSLRTRPCAPARPPRRPCRD